MPQLEGLARFVLLAMFALAILAAGAGSQQPGSAQWLALTLVATMPLAFAAFMAWLVIEQWRQWRRPKHSFGRLRIVTVLRIK